MKKEYHFYVYIMASNSGTLYVGFTNHLKRRIYEHKNDIIEGFTKKYKCHKLIYYEHFSYVHAAIDREKELKAWRRVKKEALIQTMNPTWRDLSHDIE